MGGKNRFIWWRRAEIALSLMCEISSMVGMRVVYRFGRRLDVEALAVGQQLRF